MSKQTKIRLKDYLRLKAYSAMHGVTMTEALSRAMKRLGVRKLESKEKLEFDTCGECDKAIPKDAAFCPYCGAEFEEDEDEEEEEEDESE